MDNRSFSEILTDALDEHRNDLNKLAELSRVPIYYLELLARNETAGLPPSPYLRGYIIRLSRILGLNGDLLWEIYKKEHSIKTSGSDDNLPKNRFTIETISHTNLIIAVAAVFLVLAYFIFRFDALFGRPHLVINNPASPVSDSLFQITPLAGLTDPDSKLTINGEMIEVESNGSWQKEVFLESGINNFEVTASKFLGQKTSLTRQIIYEPPAEIPSPPEPLPSPEPSPAEPTPASLPPTND